MSGNDTNGMPGANAMGDTMEFVKNLWASMKLPGMSMPSLSPEDIDKQIADLKAVESWLQMNMNMLRSTIQALEVQSATLNALRSMGQSFTNAANAASAAAAPPSFDSMPNFDSPFGTSFASSASPFQPSASSSAPSFDSPFNKPATSAEPAGTEVSDESTSAGAAGGFPDAAAMAAQFASPAAWWNTVQEQFSNAVSQALTPEKKPAGKRRATGKSKTAAKTGTRTATKSRAKTGTKTSTKTGTKNAPKSAAESAGKVSSKPASKLASQTAPKPASKATASAVLNATASAGARKRAPRS